MLFVATFIKLFCVISLLFPVVLTNGQSVPPVNVTVLLPLPTTFEGLNGTGYVIDISLTAFNSSFNSFLSTSRGYHPSFNNGLNKSIDGVGPDVSVPGLVVLFSTTPNSFSPVGNGPLTNLAGLFNMAGLTILPTGEINYIVIWLVGSAFAFNEPVTMTIFVLNDTAPLTLPADFTMMPGIISDIVTVPFQVTGPVSPTAPTSVFVPGTPANDTALDIIVFSPLPQATAGVNGFGFVIDVLVFASSPEFNGLLSAAAGYVPLNSNGTNPAINRVGPNVAAPGFVCLLNTTKAGATTNLAGLFQINGIFEDSGLNGIWIDWFVGAPNFGTGPSTLTILILNHTAPTRLDVNDPTQLVGLISPIVTVDFFISPLAGSGTVLGDPSFSGFHGQSSYQVHGIPSEVFNILSAPSLQVNSRFRFIDNHQAMTSAEMRQARRDAGRSSQLPVTAPWSHPGTYLEEMGIQLGNEVQLYLRAGAYVGGIASATLLNGDILQVGSPVMSADGQMSVTLINSHRVSVRHVLVKFDVVNSDGFFNIENAVLTSSAAFTQLDGLLGQSADPDWKAGKGQEWEAHMLLDYWVEAETTTTSSDDKMEVLFSDKFGANKFTSQSA